MNGLGDLVYYITKYTGIAWFMHKLHRLTGFECGCMKRRQKWNAKFPFRKRNG